MKYVIEMPDKEPKVVNGTDVLIQRVENAGGKIRVFVVGQDEHLEK